MVFSKGLIRILIRVVLLATFLACGIYSYYQTDYVITPMMFGIFALISAIEMTWHLQRLERDWSQFLLSIRHHDFNRNYVNQSDSGKLGEAFKLITESFEQLETEKHAEDRLLQTVLGHIPVGLMCYKEDGEIVFSNKAIKEMLGFEAFIKIENLRDRFPNIYALLASDRSTDGELIEGIGEQRILIKLEAFTLQKKNYRLVSMTDIRSTLDANELESYQKLMSVMTHEIMNSATPILSLIQVVNEKMVEKDQLKSLSQKDQKNIVISMKAIEDRTQGMLKFVEAYREINKEFVPIYESVHTSKLIEQVIPLIDAQSTVPITVEDRVDLNVKVDSNLIVQVIINLLKNAIYAVQEVKDPAVTLYLSRDASELNIIVTDNGSGIEPENVNKVFIPFYTTKTEGSGIGLATSRKIVKAHGGRLSYSRTAD
ncbi:MAG: ATP-binding protein, partial [Cyclobacteriaceae bacterium]